MNVPVHFLWMMRPFLHSELGHCWPSWRSRTRIKKRHQVLFLVRFSSFKRWKKSGLIRNVLGAYFFISTFVSGLLVLLVYWLKGENRNAHIRLHYKHFLQRFRWKKLGRLGFYDPLPPQINFLYKNLTKQKILMKKETLKKSTVNNLCQIWRVEF